MSLWKVPDEQTRELMEAFYRRVLDAHRLDEALRDARLELRRKYGSALAWGAFVYQGPPGARLLVAPRAIGSGE